MKSLIILPHKRHTVGIAIASAWLCSRVCIICGVIVLSCRMEIKFLKPSRFVESLQAPLKQRPRLWWPYFWAKKGPSDDCVVAANHRSSGKAKVVCLKNVPPVVPKVHIRDKLLKKGIVREMPFRRGITECNVATSITACFEASLSHTCKHIVITLWRLMLFKALMEQSWQPLCCCQRESSISCHQLGLSNTQGKWWWGSVFYFEADNWAEPGALS